MDSLIPFSLLELAGIESLEFDIYNEHKKIIAHRGQAIDPGFLLRLQFIKLYRKNEKLNNIDQFDNLLVSKTNKERIINLLQNENGIILVSSPDEQSRKLLLQALIENKSQSTSVFMIDDKQFTSKYPVKYIDNEENTPKLFLKNIKKELTSNNNTIIFNPNLDEELFRIICEKLASEELVIIVMEDSNCFNALSNINKIAKDKMLLSLILKGIIVQRPIASLCSCKEEYYPKDEEMYSLFEKSSVSRVKFFKPGECNLCGTTGTNGYIQLHEILAVNEELKELIIQDFPAEQIKAKALQEGFEDIKYDALKKAISGFISLNEVINLT